MNDTLKQIGATGIVPVVVLNKVSDAEPLAQALIKGGLPCAEVTFRTDAAEESIRAIAKKFPDMFCQSNYPIDIHGKSLKNIANDLVPEDDKPWYDIPFRSLLVRGIDNLMVAGRCLGAEFLVESSLRVQHSARSSGEAAGIGAALALDSGISPHAVNGADVRSIMASKGAEYA